jgi:hypothetical protein
MLSNNAKDLEGSYCDLHLHEGIEEIHEIKRGRN